MSDVKRHGKKWTITEVLKLQREYELLNLSVTEIAKNHKRSVASIMYKVEAERFICLYKTKNNCLENKTSVKSKKNLESDMESESDIDSSSDYNVDDESVLSENDDSDYEEEIDMKKDRCVDTLSERVCMLEKNVQEISKLVKYIISMYNNTYKYV